MLSIARSAIIVLLSSCLLAPLSCGSAADDGPIGDAELAPEPDSDADGTSDIAPDPGPQADPGSPADGTNQPDPDGATEPDPAVVPVDGRLVFDPPSGTFEGSLTIAITPEDGLAGTIHYTTDGSIPDATSPAYQGPITLSCSTEIQAELISEGEPKARGSSFYVLRAKDIALDLPVVVIEAFGAGEPDRDYMRAAFMVFDLHEGQAALSAPPDLAVRSGFHLRGESSALFDKRPYRVELRDRFDEDEDWPVLGMPADADWVLRGPFVDRALIREAFHYDLGANMGMPSPRYVFCELYKNLDGDALDDDDYEGVYMVVETIKNAKDRLDLKQLEPTDTTLPDITGGYIWKFEYMASEEPLLDCPGAVDCWSELEIVDPKDINVQQELWLADHLYAFHLMLRSPELADPTAGYPAYIDPLSFADQVIINELGREIDAYTRSAFFYKDRGGLIHAGPLWDYNLTLGTGMSGMYDNMSTSGWTYDINSYRLDSNDWFLLLLDDLAFQALLTARWQELRAGLLSDAALNERIDGLVAPLAAAAERNFQRWPNLDATYIIYMEGPGTTTWQEQVAYCRDWLMERVAWLDAQWN